MAEKRFDKLVRDKIPNIIAGNQAVAETRILSQLEIIPALLQKLVEETAEFEEANGDDKLSELADMQEVIDALTAETGYTIEQRRQRQLAKAKERGGFEQRIFLEKTVIND